MLVWFLAGNCMITMLYAVVKAKRQGEYGAAIFFAFLPGLGFLIYFLPLIFQRFLENRGVDREAVLTHALEVEQMPERPNVAEELNVVPVEDAMAIGKNTEKRTLLLKQMKKDLKENYKILMVAEEDEDSETAHYAAAAKMEIYRLLQQQWMDCRRDYEKSPQEPEKYHAACDALIDILGSGVFSVREQRGYRKHLSEYVQGQLSADESVVSLREYKACLDALVELGRVEPGYYAEVERLWQEKADRMRDESTYQIILKMFYQTKEREKFESCLEDLRKNRQVRLSAQGLEQLRYWTNRLDKIA